MTLVMQADMAQVWAVGFRGCHVRGRKAGIRAGEHIDGRTSLLPEALSDFYRQAGLITDNMGDTCSKLALIGF